MVYPFCHICKGTKQMCGLNTCPLLDEVRRRVQPMNSTGDHFEGPSPPSVFIGSFGYPKLTIGPLASPNPVPMPERLERSSFLYERSIGEVYSIRSSLVRGKYKLGVKAASDPWTVGSQALFDIEQKMPVRGRKILDSVQEISLSSRHIDTEMRLSRDLSMIDPVSVDAITMPMGPSVDLKGVRVIDNVRVDRPVEKAVSDSDMNAVTAANELYSGGIGLDQLTRLLSVGLLGEKKRRRLVPTRWSITAVDDTLSLHLKEKVLEQTHLDNYLLYSGNRFGNHFLIAFYPPPFRYEMLEQWQKGSLWGSGNIAADHEGPMGRKNYASRITGAYYAARLSALEHLMRIGKCAGISVIRWITDEYWAPLGVWVIRETVKKALERRPEEFPDMKSLISRMDGLCEMKGWKHKTRFLTGRIDTSLERFI